MSQSLASRLQQAVRTIELIERVVKGPASGPDSEVAVAPGVKVRTLARRVDEMSFGLANAADADIELLTPQSGSEFALRGLSLVAPLSAQVVGPNIRIAIDLSEYASDAELASLSTQLTSAVASVNSALIALDASKAAVSYVDAGLALKVNAGDLLSALSDGGGFVRMTDAERAKLTTLTANFKGAHASLAALNSAHPAGSSGDWAIITQGAGLPATFAAWDSDNSPAAWIDTGASAPTTIDWSAVTGKPATFPPATHSHVKAEVGLGNVDNTSDANKPISTATQTAVTAAAPPGMVSVFAMSSAPTGWLKANGAAVSRTTYASLFAAIGTTFGAGDGTTTFNVPDLRGEFVRGWDDGRGVDTARAIGSAQLATRHPYVHANGTPALIAPVNITPANADSLGGDVPRGYTGVLTTSGTVLEHYTSRPRNVALLACIKY